MAFVTADVVPTPGGEAPFKVVFQAERDSARGNGRSSRRRSAGGESVEFLQEAVEDDD